MPSIYLYYSTAGEKEKERHIVFSDILGAQGGMRNVGERTDAACVRRLAGKLAVRAVGL